MDFEFYTAARVVFGDGAIERLGQLLAPLGARALLVVGARSAAQTGLLARLERLIPLGAVSRCAREPRIEDVDATVAQARAAGCDVVVAVGGGAVLDCGKAAAGMITNSGSLLDYLEGVGAGRKIEAAPAPLVAVPTTAGTGSEVTKNAVISGPGYKKSVRSPLLIPRVALVDPRLTHSTPPAVTAACGMDALTQLIEAYLSSGASPFTDGLALQGVRAAGRSLARAHRDGDDAEARRDMALASLLGGVCLANAGLGAVHGFASPIGALFPAAHGEVCAALLPQVLRGNLAAARGTQSEARLRARVGDLAAALGCAGQGDGAIDRCVEHLQQLQQQLCIRSLGELGITRDDLPRIVAGARGSSMKTNPLTLSDQQLGAILEAAL